MRSPFPGVDPYPENPVLWPDVHNRLIAAVSDAISPLVFPKYYVAFERRTYALAKGDWLLVGGETVQELGEPTAETRVLEVAMPAVDEVTDAYLEVHDVKHGTLVTVIELLSPGNKLHAAGRADYLTKRAQISRTRTSLVEIDLLRVGEPMPLVGSLPRGGYRILVSRGARLSRFVTASAAQKERLAGGLVGQFKQSGL